MELRGAYDHILLVTNDLVNDRRMIKICDFLASSEKKKVLLIGRQLKDSISLKHKSFDQYRLKCWFKGGPLFYLEINIRFLVMLKQLQFTTLTANDIDTVLSGLLLRRIRKFEFFIDCHEYFSEVPELTGRPIKKWLWRKLAYKAIGVSDKRYTVNAQLAEQLMLRYRRKFKIVRNVPNDWDKYLPRRTEDNFTIVYLGVLNQGRGLIEMIEAMLQLTFAKLKIIGDGVLKDNLKKLVAKYGLHERVELLGSLSEAEFGEHLINSDMGINLLDNSSQNYFYSSANKFYDYLSYGLPVLTMRFPVYEAFVNQHPVAFLIDDLTMDSIVKGVNEIHSNKIKERLVNLLPQIKKTHAWSMDQEVLKEIYDVT